MMRRGPALVLIAALLMAGVVVGRDGGAGTGSVASGPDPATLLSVGPPDDALDSIWFCAGQTAGDDTAADGTVVIANLGDSDATGTVEVVSDAGDAAAEPVEVAARTTERVRVADVLTADWAAATVQMDQSSIIVEHEVVGPHGRDAAACQTRASDRWYLPAGATTRDAQLTLLIYNPYRDAALIDLAFTTAEGVRRPTALDGVPIEAGGVRAVDVSGVVTVREVVATTLTARRGRVVVDRIQTYDGRGSSTTDDEAATESYRTEGITVTPGVPARRPMWDLPAGVRSPGIHERITVFNPGRRDAEVELTFSLREPERNGELDPFPLAVPAGEFEVFEVDATDAIPEGITHAVAVRSVNGVPVVAERSLAAAEGASYLAALASTGSPVAARRWGFAAGRRNGEADSQRVALHNPGDEEVEVRLVAFGDGRRTPAPVPEGPVVLGPDEHREVLVTDVPDDRTSIEVIASAPIVAERRIIAQGPGPDAPPDDADAGEAAGEADEDEEVADTDEEDEDEEDADTDEEEDEIGIGASTAIGIPLGHTVVVLDD